MKTSDIFKTNRAAEDGKISSEQYEKFHVQFAQEFASDKLEDDKKANEWLSDQVKDFNEKVYLESVDEQKSYFIDKENKIQESHDKQTYINLQQFKKDAQIKSDALAKYIDNQRSELKRAIEDKNIIKQDFLKKHDALKGMQARLVAIDQKHNRLILDHKEQSKIRKESTVEAKSAYINLEKNYSKNDNFNIKAPVHIDAAEYALNRDRAFTNKLESMSGESLKAVDVDARERIQLEVERQKSAYAIDQNINIETLTQNSRADEIEKHAEYMNQVNRRIAEVEIKLEEKGFKVDFNGAEVDIREIRDEERIASNLKSDINSIENQEVQKTKFDQLNEEMANTESQSSIAHIDINQMAKDTYETRQKLEQEVEKIEVIKNSLAERLEHQREAARRNNANMRELTGGRPTSRELEMQKEARESQRQRAIEQQNRELMKLQEAQQNATRAM